MIVVADASVALKWFLPGDTEDDTGKALELLEAAAFGRLQLVQPVHFIAEVAAVLARLKPAQAQDDLLDLLHIEQQIADSPEIYATAIELAEQLDHHLFDTLYHAVAQHTPEAIFVTADRRYHAKRNTWEASCH
ncbi:type II toxin-antitoxin system VapC family toxin [Azonexus sp.]|uniref:type II toxin-antitoxin system VapC family toxin n=1 Tax=Azonexus sp. TaxID=1872668 RepID=UPI0039E21564